MNAYSSDLGLKALAAVDARRPQEGGRGQLRRLLSGPQAPGRGRGPGFELLAGQDAAHPLNRG
jgi:hypothetical protein